VSSLGCMSERKTPPLLIISRTPSEYDKSAKKDKLTYSATSLKRPTGPTKTFHLTSVRI
jgi:hypothetical protein